MLVEAGEGFVEQQDLGLEHERAGQRHALLLATRELVGEARAIARKPDELEDGLDAALDLLGRQAAELEPEGEVLEHVHVGPERVALEHHSCRSLLGRRFGDVVAVDPDAAAGGRLEAAHHA